MIPVFQTRGTTDELGNCFEACLASILELPLSVIPDRADYAPADWVAQVEAARARGKLADLEIDLGPWSDALRAWLSERGVSWLELPVSRRRDLTERGWLELVAEIRAGYWIGVHASGGEAAHAVVYQGTQIVHNPTRGLLDGEGLDELIAVHVLVVSDARRLVRELGREMLPDLDGARRRLDARVAASVESGELSPEAGAAWAAAG